MTESLFDEVGYGLHRANVGQTEETQTSDHWFSAHPDPLDLDRWNARIPFTYLGQRFEASVPATAIHDRKVVLYSEVEVSKQTLRDAGFTFTLGFTAAFWKLYNNAIMNPADLS